MIRYLALGMLALISNVEIALAQVVCRSDEQRGCLTIQVVGVEFDANLMDRVERMSASQQADSLGMHVYEGMLDGRYEPVGAQSYVLFLWMDEEWGSVPLPSDRIVQICYNGTQPGYTMYQPRGLVDPDSFPILNDPRQPNLGVPHTALAADCNGRGAGWAIPYDVMEHVVVAFICPVGNTNYPFRRNGRQEGILHYPAEIQWYLDQGWEFVLSAAVW